MQRSGSRHPRFSSSPKLLQMRLVQFSGNEPISSSGKYKFPMGEGLEKVKNVINKGSVNTLNTKMKETS